MKIIRGALTFDDVLLLPGYSDFKRSEVDLKVKLSSAITLGVPVISSPMDTVTESEMALSMAKFGCLGVIHRNLSPLEQSRQVGLVKRSKVTDLSAALDFKKRYLVGAAVGIGADFKERVDLLIKAEVDLLVIDSGHGNTSFVCQAIKDIKNKTRICVMAGNIATAEGAENLLASGCDILRVGMGPGSICTTRIISGMGVPQLWAIAQAVKVARKYRKTVVADGGIKQFGDIAKALGTGAQAVMLGSLLSGFSESAGEIVVKKGMKFKAYRGMGSISAMKKGGAERYGQQRKTAEKKLIAEGVEAIVPYRGEVADFLLQMEGSLRSSFYYLGAKNLLEFHKKAVFVKITQGGFTESHPHSVKIINTGNNYF